jgi:aminocarboxymuconate-semialdehyde decarboxylase
MKVVDLDSHSEPRPQDVTIEPEYSHLRPRTFSNAKGDRQTIFDNKVMIKVSKAEQQRDPRTVTTDWKASRYDGGARYGIVTEAGIDHQFIAAGVGNTTFCYTDAKVGASFCRAYNNFIYNTFMKPYPKTFSGLPQLPLQDCGESIKELERCVKELGMRTVYLPTNWNGIDLADPHWWNFYDKVRDLGITGIIVHIETLSANSKWVGQERLKILGGDGTRGRRILSHPFEYCTTITNLIFTGMMDNFPDFRFAFLEADAEFAIVLKHRIEENLDNVPYLKDMLSHPLEWYFDRLYFLVEGLMFEHNAKRLRQAIDEFGEDHLFFGSDMPHTDGLDNIAAVAEFKKMDGLSDKVKEKILGGNAFRIIGDSVM